MRALWSIFRVIVQDQRTAMLRGAVLSVVVLAMGAALLGLSGWFITAAAAAGLAGTGAVFDVFRPSATVRFLALGRAAARYGERMLTHDATLRALESLRLRVLASHLAAPYPRMIKARGAQALNRLTADIDALDGVPLRLVLPMLAGLAVLGVALVMLWILVAPEVALWVVGGYLFGAATIFGWMARVTIPLSRRAEVAAQAFRTRLIDMIRGRRDLAVFGRLVAQNDAVQEAEQRRLGQRRQLDLAERRAGAALVMLASVVAAGALGIGLALAGSGQIEPAFAALGFFAALALAETLAPLRRAVSDLGRMADAARRVGRDLADPAPKGDTPRAPSNAGGLHVNGLTLLRSGTRAPLVHDISVAIRAGETVAITGASGSGKSTLLLAIAGLHAIEAGEILLGSQDVRDWSEADLRSHLTLLPQRSALMAGTAAEALRLASPAEDARLWEVLAAVKLDAVVAAKGGLSMRIGARGEGISGGEARRLALARALLRAPKVLLLDEPTEGLDDPTARAVLQGIRTILPDAAILIAAHRGAETEFADRLIALDGSWRALGTAPLKPTNMV
ncbi:amino acid ABC transporter ATP-binding/permease protein [Albirhodobacter sp. R86504]|uniref:amino acid ABC transporter ATP-binding/permease protein n=1 Tax=Albirhodobacter sp. R86504 TaxID=3093848 RepID=UPI0036715768